MAGAAALLRERDRQPLHLDDYIGEAPRPDVAQPMLPRTLVPARERPGPHRDPIDRPVAIQPLDLVPLDADRRVIEMMRVERRLLARFQHDPPDPHLLI